MQVGMIFALVFTVFVIVFLLAGGMRMIDDFFNLGCDAQINKGIQEFRHVADKEVYWQPIGGSRLLEFAVPSCVARACFFNHLDPRPNPVMGWEGDPQIESLIRHSNYTVFLFKKNGEGQGYATERASRARENFCITSTQGIMLTSMGKYVEIAPAS